jgi:hypothetical protein
MGKSKQKKYYVSMTDTFMSGWGEARDKINKLIFLCDTMEEAQIVKDNAEQRTDQKYINICTQKPYYNKYRYSVQIKTKEEYNSWYVKNFFRKQRYAEEAI